MSDTTPDRTLHATPDANPPAELTGAPVAVHTELLRLTEPATAAELALSAGVGRSTAGKALTTLEQHGLAARTPGGHEGRLRTPDRWRAAPTHEAGQADGLHRRKSLNAQPDSPLADTAQSANTGQDHNGAPAGGTTPDTAAVPDDDSADAATSPVTGALQTADKGAPDNGSEEAAPHDENHRGASGDENPPSPQQETTGPQPAPREAITLPGQRKRLAPGALRQMVIDHLQAHPSEAFTATKICRVIEKSSGAIANALVTLEQQGIAEQVSDKPRTYRLARVCTTNGGTADHGVTPDD